MARAKPDNYFFTLPNFATHADGITIGEISDAL